MNHLRLVRIEPEIYYRRSFKRDFMEPIELQPTIEEFDEITKCEGKCQKPLPEHRLAYLPDGRRICATCLYSDKREGGDERG